MGIEMLRNDDGNVKIYGEQQKEKIASAAEVQQLVQEIKRQRLNGNSEKAKRIGARLAEIAPGGDNQDSAELTEVLGDKLSVPSALYQIRVLLIFAAESNLHMMMPTAFLATTSINALYDALIENEPRFYDNISDGASFTFYYLRLRSGGDIYRGIGEAFAMLCDRENDESFIGLGSTVYGYILKKMEELIKEEKFVEE